MADEAGRRSGRAVRISIMSSIYKKTDKDWQWVLNAWREKGGAGLTLHQLATICERAPLAILREIRADKNAGWSICQDINAPVFFWGREFEFYYGRTSIRHFAKTKGIDRLAEIMLEICPWPQYKGLADWEGVKSAHHGITLATYKLLQRAAAKKED